VRRAENLPSSRFSSGQHFVPYHRRSQQQSRVASTSVSEAEMFEASHDGAGRCGGCPSCLGSFPSPALKSTTTPRQTSYGAETRAVFVACRFVSEESRSTYYGFIAALPHSDSPLFPQFITSRNTWNLGVLYCRRTLVGTSLGTTSLPILHPTRKRENLNITQKSFWRASQLHTNNSRARQAHH
jgi:hypothetical protein